ncbi:hypothetical protein Vafri_16108 [Volvox africanus]|nr:hypothetical protein Vafri_16108 [Volvox africanus]
MAAPNPTCPSFKKWRGVSNRTNQRLQEDVKPPVFAPKFNIYVPPDLQDLLQTRPRKFTPDELIEAVAAITASDKMQWFPATVAIRKALSKEDTPPIQHVVDLGALPRLVFMMSLSDSPELQLEAAWAVCNVASGNSTQCAAAVEAGALPPALQLLSSEASKLREQAAWLLGNVAGDGAALRDKCLEAGMLPVLLAAADKETEVKPLRQLAWLLLNVTRFKPRRRETLLEVLPTVACIASSTKDDETLADSLSALAHIADDCIAEVVNGARAAVERAGQLVNDPWVSVLVARVCVFVCVYVYVYACMCICMCVRACVFVCVCVYVYLYVYVKRNKLAMHEGNLEFYVLVLQYWLSVVLCSICRSS